MRRILLALSCLLLAPVFLVAVSSSAAYNAWYDLDENGKVDIFDVVRLAGTYGTAGDPAKNVTIAQYATMSNSFSGILLPSDTDSVSIDTRGYREISIGVKMVGDVEVSVYWVVGPASSSYLVDTFGPALPTLKTYAVHGDSLRITFTNVGGIPASTQVDYYLTT